MKGFKTVIRKIPARIAGAAATTAAAAEGFVIKAMASDNGLDDIDVNDSSSEMVTNVISVVLTLARYAGAFLLVYGLIMLFMGFKNEDAEAKHRAGLVVIAGIALVAVKSIVTAVTGLNID